MLQRVLLWVSCHSPPESDPEYLITGTHPYPSAPGVFLTLSLVAKPYSVISFINWTVCLWCSGVALTTDTQLQKMPSEAAVHSMALALPPSQARYTHRLLETSHGWKTCFFLLLCVCVCIACCRQDMARTAASIGDIHRHAGAAERSQPPQHTLVSRSHSFPCHSFIFIHTHCRDGWNHTLCK